MLADVPSNDLYEHWAEGLREALDFPRNGRWHVAANGTVTLTTYQGALPEGGDVDALIAALAVIEDVMKTDGELVAQAEAELDISKAERQLDIEAIRGALPAWVEEMTFENRELAGMNHGWRVAVTPEVARLRFPNPGTYPEFVEIWNIIRLEQMNMLLQREPEAYFPCPSPQRMS